MSDLMATFPQWSDEDSRDLDDFLSDPWHDEDQTSDRTADSSSDNSSWPGFEPDKWRSVEIVSISAIPSDEQAQDDRDEQQVDDRLHDDHKFDWSKGEVRELEEEEEDEDKTLTLSTMAGATADLYTAASRRDVSTPTKTQRLRQKLPMLLCKTSKMKQPSPGDKCVHFSNHSDEKENEEAIAVPPHSAVRNLGFANHAEPQKEESIVAPRHYAGRNARFNNHTESQNQEVVHVPRYYPGRNEGLDPINEAELPELLTTTRPLLKIPRSTKVKELCFQDSSSSSRVEAYSGKCSPSNWIHNANLFHDKTMPSNALDYFCRDSALGAEVPCVQVSYNSSEEDSTVSSESSNGSDVSSLRGGAVDAKLAHLFSLSSIQEDRRGNVREEANHVHDDTNYHHHHHHKPVTRFTHLRPAGSKVADRQKWLQEAFQKQQEIENGDKPQVAPTPKVPQVATAPKVNRIPATVSNVSGTIQKFGGKQPRLSAVQLRKQELERKLSVKSPEEKPLVKTKWEARAGSYYRKKVVISSHYN